MATATPTVTFTHPLYDEHEEQIRFIGNIYNGIDTARPLLKQAEHEHSTDFANRVEASTLENFTKEIVRTVSGEIMRKPLMLENVTEAQQEDLQTVSGLSTINQFTKDLLVGAIRDGKAFVLVDLPINGGKASLNLIHRLQLTNWKKDENGIFTQVVLKESYLEENGVFGIEIKMQYRVINTIGNVTIWRQIAKSGNWEIFDEILTTYNFCPFFEVDLGETPVLYDIASKNFAHFNLDSNLYDFVDFALQPTLAFFGAGSGDEDIGEENKSSPKIVLGVRSSLWIDDNEADVKWIEQDGKNYEIGKDKLDVLKVSISKSYLKLQDGSIQNKTATQTSSENKQSESFNSDLAETVEVCINSAVNAMYLMQNRTFTGKIIVNRDFSAKATVGTTAELTTAWLSGGISHNTYLKALNDSEAISIENIDDEIELTANEGMGLEEAVE